MESEKTQCETSSDSLTDGQLPDNDDIQSPVSKLPIECLIHIFSMLPIADRVRIQRVCKHWQAVSLKSWISLKTLGFKETDWANKYWLSGREKVDNIVFKKVLKLCGPHVTCIDFSKHNRDIGREYTIKWRFFRGDVTICQKYIATLHANKRFFGMIKNLCPNLTALDIRSLEITEKGLECLAKSFSNLTEFAIDDCTKCYWVLDELLSLLFRNNKNLRRVMLHVLSNANCLSNLNPKAIKEISVMLGLVRKESVCRALEKFLNLHSLSIILNKNFEAYEEQDVTYINKMLMAIEPHSENLKELDINIISAIDYNIHVWESEMDFSPVLIHSKNFKCFTNLQKLLLEGQKLKIDFNTITNYCTKLTCVKLTDLLVTDSEMASIIQLPELQELHLWCLDQITDAIFINRVSFLKILDCSYCSRLTNAGFRSVLQNSSKSLQRLTVTECRNVDLDNLILDAKKATDTRSTRSLLKMFVNYKAESLLQKEKETKFNEFAKSMVNKAEDESIFHDLYNLSEHIGLMIGKAKLSNQKRTVTKLSKYLELIEYTSL